MSNKTVQFQVFSVDKYARHKHSGETEVRLSDLDLVRPIRLWLNLREMDEVKIEVDICLPSPRDIISFCHKNDRVDFGK